MTAVKRLTTTLSGLLPDRRRERYDPFDDIDRVVGRDEPRETGTLEYPLPDEVNGTDRVRVILHTSSGDVLELEESLIHVTDGVLEAEYPAVNLGAFDVRVRAETTGGNR